MKIPTELYSTRKEEWPSAGRHILAHYDATSIVVYQAYPPAIGRFAAQHSYFGGDFSFSRMSWLKPNFLWMMYRSGWGRKQNQEVTLAVRIQRHFFESILEQAVPSAYDAGLCADTAEWKLAIASSCVRLQWGPDHSPAGDPVQRRAIQLGLRDQALKEYAHEAIFEIEDISEFVEEQRPHVKAGSWDCLVTPVERVYRPTRPEVTAKLKLANPE